MTWILSRPLEAPPEHCKAEMCHFPGYCTNRNQLTQSQIERGLIKGDERVSDFRDYISRKPQRT